MSGFSIEGGEITITDGARTVFTTAGTLVNLLPGGVSTTVNVVFPDFTKDYFYNWWWYVDSIFQGGSFSYPKRSGCLSSVSVPAQEWAATDVIAGAPTGADFFAARARINRVASPSHAWGGSSIQVLPVTNQWIPFTGSVLVEAELGMARAFSLYLDGGNLVLHRQQSVSTPPGGWGTYGDTPDGVGEGGSVTFASAAGLPVLPLDAKDTTGVGSGPVGSLPLANHQAGRGDSCSTSDPTNYSSTYQVEITGQFGRRS